MEEWTTIRAEDLRDVLAMADELERDAQELAEIQQRLSRMQEGMKLQATHIREDLARLSVSPV